MIPIVENRIGIVILCTAICSIIAYLLGSINSAVIVSKLVANEDIRNFGSGNAGMTNILRTYGKKAAFFTFIGDFFKGFIAVMIAKLIFWLVGITSFNPSYLVGFFALIGHLFPVFFKFKGGKGLLTSAGVALACNPLIFCILAVVMIPLVFWIKIVSIVSISCAILFPFATYFVTKLQGGNYILDTMFSSLFGIIIIYMHRANIKRLINGTEPKFGAKK